MPYRLHVVYRTIPTSNHNPSIALPHHGKVVYRTIPTSNHNWVLSILATLTLYIVLFLHQTTTAIKFVFASLLLYIVLFLHQTTTQNLSENDTNGCISYYSYIKPQLSTRRMGSDALYIVLFLHQTTTQQQTKYRISGCISYYSYIKPQLILMFGETYLVVYRTIPTSNHNETYKSLIQDPLYIVLFLHQTTTGRLVILLSLCCISYYSYIKPQHYHVCPIRYIRCISYYSYIKPQR